METVNPKKGKLVDLPTAKVKALRLAKENLETIMDKLAEIDSAVIVFRIGTQVTVFASDYDMEAIGAIELAKLRILDEVLSDECECEEE